MEKFDVIIPAAGSGTRMGSNIPKLVMEVGGKAIIRRTVETFLDNFPCCRITVVTAEDAIKEALTGLPVRFAPGGASRAESVYNGLKSLSSVNVESRGKVLVHDGARCLIDKDTIQGVLDALERFEAATCGVPEKNTFKKITRRGDDIIVENTPSRSDYYEVQTPQGYRYDTMLKCFDPSLIGDNVTDDVMFAEIKGIEVAIVEGSYSNIKITTPEDISFAEGLLSGI